MRAFTSDPQLLMGKSSVARVAAPPRRFLTGREDRDDDDRCGEPKAAATVPDSTVPAAS